MHALHAHACLSALPLAKMQVMCSAPAACGLGYEDVTNMWLLVTETIGDVAPLPLSVTSSTVRFRLHGSLQIDVGPENQQLISIGV